MNHEFFSPSNKDCEIFYKDGLSFTMLVTPLDKTLKVEVRIWHRQHSPRFFLLGLYEELPSDTKKETIFKKANNICQMLIEEISIIGTVFFTDVNEKNEFSWEEKPPFSNITLKMKVDYYASHTKVTVEMWHKKASPHECLAALYDDELPPDAGNELICETGNCFGRSLLRELPNICAKLDYENATQEMFYALIKHDKSAFKNAFARQETARKNL